MRLKAFNTLVAGIVSYVSKCKAAKIVSTRSLARFDRRPCLMFMVFSLFQDVFLPPLSGLQAVDFMCFRNPKRQ